MRNDLISLKMVLDEMKLPVQIDDFANRLKLQKALYLIQISGIDLGYRYSWYLRGPYSTALTKDLFELDANVEEYKNVSEEYNFADDIRSSIGTCKVLLAKPSCISVPDEEWYELLASLHYLKHIAYLSDFPDSASKGFNIVYRNLPDDKRVRFPEPIAREGWDFLDNLGLIKHKELNT